MVRLDDILEIIQSYNQGADLDALRKAYIFSAKVHQGQVRLLVASLGPDGAMAPVKEITLPIKIPAEQMEAGGPPAIGYKVALSGDESRLATVAEQTEQTDRVRILAHGEQLDIRRPLLRSVEQAPQIIPGETATRP